MTKLLFYASFLLLIALKALCSDIKGLKKPGSKIALANEFVNQVAQGIVSKETALEYLFAIEKEEETRHTIAEALLLNQLFLTDETLFCESLKYFKAEVFDILPVHEHMLSIESLNRLREVKDSKIIFKKLLKMLNKLESEFAQIISDYVPKDVISVIFDYLYLYRDKYAIRTILLLALERYNEIDSTMIVLISETKVFQDRDLENIEVGLDCPGVCLRNLKSEFHKQFCEEYNKRNLVATSLCPTDDWIKSNINYPTVTLKISWLGVNMDSKEYFQMACRNSERSMVYCICNIIDGKGVKTEEDLLETGVDVKTYKDDLLQIALGRNAFLTDLVYKSSPDFFTDVLTSFILDMERYDYYIIEKVAASLIVLEKFKRFDKLNERDENMGDFLYNAVVLKKPIWNQGSFNAILACKNKELHKYLFQFDCIREEAFKLGKELLINYQYYPRENSFAALKEILEEAEEKENMNTVQRSVLGFIFKNGFPLSVLNQIKNKDLKEKYFKVAEIASDNSGLIYHSIEACKISDYLYLGRILSNFSKPYSRIWEGKLHEQSNGFDHNLKTYSVTASSDRTWIEFFHKDSKGYDMINKNVSETDLVAIGVWLGRLLLTDAQVIGSNLHPLLVKGIVDEKLSKEDEDLIKKENLRTALNLIKMGFQIGCGDHYVKSYFETANDFLAWIQVK